MPPKIETVLMLLLFTFARYYYQMNPERLGTCPLTIHALLHIADSILETGPVWTAWAFPILVDVLTWCGGRLEAVNFLFDV